MLSGGASMMLRELGASARMPVLRRWQRWSVIGAAATLLPLVAVPAVHADDPAITPSTAPSGATAPAMDGPSVGGPLLASRGVVTAAGAGIPPVPRLDAATWLLADATTGEVLAARGAHIRRAPASTLKTLTALTLIPRLEADALYEVTADDVSVDGSKVGLLVGQRYSHRDLFTALFLPSGNDAAAALANANGGRTPTVEQMNQQARALGALDTLARDPSGLDAPGQLSSAYDLALMARAGLADPQFSRYAALRTAQFPGRTSASGRRTSYQIQTQNPLLREGYRGALGIKTGFTTKAGRTFVGAAERGGRTLIVTLMGIEEPTGEAAARLLDWGFANAPRIAQPVGVLVEPAPLAEPQDVAETAAATQAQPVAGEPGPLLRSLTGAAIILGLGMLTVAIRSSDPFVRRRIRRRYR